MQFFPELTFCRTKKKEEERRCVPWGCEFAASPMCGCDAGSPVPCSPYLLCTSYVH